MITGATSNRSTASRTPATCSAPGAGCVFIDFETCCRGPVEFDLAHVPEAVTASYGHIDEELLLECRVLVLAMVAGVALRSR